MTEGMGLEGRLPGVLSPPHQREMNLTWRGRFDGDEDLAGGFAREFRLKHVLG